MILRLFYCTLGLSLAAGCTTGFRETPTHLMMTILDGQHPTPNVELLLVYPVSRKVISGRTDNNGSASLMVPCQDWAELWLHRGVTNLGTVVILLDSKQEVKGKAQLGTWTKLSPDGFEINSSSLLSYEKYPYAAKLEVRDELGVPVRGAKLTLDNANYIGWTEFLTDDSGTALLLFHSAVPGKAISATLSKEGVYLGKVKLTFGHNSHFIIGSIKTGSETALSSQRTKDTSAVQHVNL